MKAWYSKPAPRWAKLLDIALDLVVVYLLAWLAIYDLPAYAKGVAECAKAPCRVNATLMNFTPNQSALPNVP